MNPNPVPACFHRPNGLALFILEVLQLTADTLVEPHEPNLHALLQSSKLSPESRSSREYNSNLCWMTAQSILTQKG